VDDAENFYGNGILSHNSIYQWRGARPELLLQFVHSWDAHRVTMHRNYRSGRSIVTAANCLIDSMDERLAGDMRITAEREEEGVITLTQYEDPEEEARSVAQQILMRHESGTPWREMCVLYRVNASSRALEEAMVGAEIPYVVVGGVCFYERKEVRDLLAYLRVASGKGKFEDVARSVNTPFRYLGNAFVQTMEFESRREEDPDEIDWVALVDRVASKERLQSRQREGVSQWQRLVKSAKRRIDEGSKPSVILEEIVRQTDYLEYLRRTEGRESTENDRASNVQELIRAAGQFPSSGELLRYVASTVKESKRVSKDKTKDRVQMMTVHRVKGLEFDVVFGVQFNEDLLPHRHAEVDEERRVAYVLITRARHELHLSFLSMQAGGTGLFPASVSRFAAEAGLYPDAEMERSGAHTALRPMFEDEEELRED
jgi:DNA helicase-2/ATP-dependent DNA helicase PcrA